MKLETVDPSTLTPNPWNSNRVSQENKQKLEVSLNRLGNFKPILVRTLDDGTLQILGGENRRNAELDRGSKLVQILNLGRIDETRAKEISLADNERFGEDDSEALQRLLNSLDTVDELSTFLPISDDEFDSFWDKASISLDDLDLDDDDDLPTNLPTPAATAPTHRVVRFKLPIADSERLTELVEKTQKSNGFTTSDALTNAGDALIHILGKIW